MSSSTDLHSSVKSVGNLVTQILHFSGGEKRTFEHIKADTIKQWEFTKMRTVDGRMIMINTKNVDCVEIFSEWNTDLDAEDELNDEIKNSKIRIWSDNYFYLQIQKNWSDNNVNIGSHFLVSSDSDEVTIVTKESNVPDTKYDNKVWPFKVFEIVVSKPFLVKWFLAKISNTIAKANINILIVSTFSKDYVLVKSEDAEHAKKELQAIGFDIK